MNTSRMSRRLLILAIMLASLSALATAQVPPLITACVKANGTIRIIATGKKCIAKEHHITWPAKPTGGVSYYQRSATAKLLNIPMTVVAVCDAPGHTATGGGYHWEPDPLISTNNSCWVQMSASCRSLWRVRRTCGQRRLGGDDMELCSRKPGPGNACLCDLQPAHGVGPKPPSVGYGVLEISQHTKA